MTLIYRRTTAVCLAAFAVAEVPLVSVTLSIFYPDLGSDGIFIRAFWSASGMLTAALIVALQPGEKPTNITRLRRTE